MIGLGVDFHVCLTGQHECNEYCASFGDEFARRMLIAAKDPDDLANGLARVESHEEISELGALLADRDFAALGRRLLQIALEGARADILEDMRP